MPRPHLVRNTLCFMMAVAFTVAAVPCRAKSGDPFVAHQNNRTEWIAAGPQVAVAPLQGTVGGGVAVQFPTLNWSYLSWTILEANVAVGPNHLSASGGTRLGVPLLFGAAKRHQLRLSLGLAFGGGDVEQHAPGYMGPQLIPSIEYRFQVSDHFVTGVGFQVVLPLANLISAHCASGPCEKAGYPLIIQWVVPFGWTS